jgi:hypothetical protein
MLREEDVFLGPGELQLIIDKSFAQFLRRVDGRLRSPHSVVGAGDSESH